MKTEHERLNELFIQGLKSFEVSTPDFDAMWDLAAKERVKKKMRLAWRIAASVALLAAAAVGIILRVNRDGRHDGTKAQIASWHEPTKTLLMSSSDIQFNGLAGWTSPTDFLLTANTIVINEIEP